MAALDGVFILAAIAVPALEGVPRRAQEAALRTNLQTMCDAIEQYEADKKELPPSLDALVEDGYLRFVPIDPFTRSATTWIVERSPADAGIVALRSGARDPHLRAADCRGHDA